MLEKKQKNFLRVIYRDIKPENAKIKATKQQLSCGRIIKEAINYALGNFIPDLMFEKLVKHYSLTKKLYGEKLIKALTGYDPKYIERNVRLPEFRRLLKKRLIERIEILKENELINKDYTISDKGFQLASFLLYTEELPRLTSYGIKLHKKFHPYGIKDDIKNYVKGDRYRNIAIKSSIKLCIRRGHKRLRREDLKSFERKSKSKICVVYALDASSSMIGEKIDLCKKAGIALALKAIEERDKVGLLVFNSEIKEEVKPTYDFRLLLDRITRIKAAKRTDMASVIGCALRLFPSGKVTKHLILITDAMPTVGDKPEEETLNTVERVRNNKITISVVGINLSKKAKKLAEEIVKIGNGKLYVIKNLKNLDKVVLEDYYNIS